jgi:amino acid adenylation domain-containing protein
LDYIVSILGVLKSGGAYVPVDPEYPSARIAFILEDSGAGIVLVRRASAKALPETFSGKVFRADKITARASKAAPPRVSVSMKQLAYLLYTSGTTGKPKGVEIEHRGIVNLARSLGEMRNVSPSDRVLQFFNIAFDAAVEDIFVTLCAGATLVLCGMDVLETVRQQHVTVVTITPSVLTATLTPEEVPEVALVSVAGEPCPRSLVDTWCAAGKRFLNFYGPTEATVASSGGELSAGHRVDIGAPLTNVQLYVVSKELQLMPIGVSGELLIGGVNLARGYHGLPERTAQAFIANPFGEGRLYRTGDLARWLPNGKLELLGRNDHQVKLRGFRIELGEIEAALAKQPGIKVSTCIKREDVQGSPYLAAYVVPNRGHPDDVDVAALRSAMAIDLPRYMVPSVVMAIKELPRTSNGKVDHDALPPPGDAMMFSMVAFAAPTTLTEATVVHAFVEVLGRSNEEHEVGINDDFVELGGNSLLVIMLSNTLHKATGVRLATVQLLALRTVTAIAKEIDAVTKADNGEIQPQLQLSDEEESGGSRFQLAPAVLDELQRRARLAVLKLHISGRLAAVTGALELPHPGPIVAESVRTVLRANRSAVGVTGLLLAHCATDQELDAMVELESYQESAVDDDINDTDIPTMMASMEQTLLCSARANGQLVNVVVLDKGSSAVLVIVASPAVLDWNSIGPIMSRVVNNLTVNQESAVQESTSSAAAAARARLYGNSEHLRKSIEYFQGPLDEMAASRMVLPRDFHHSKASIETSQVTVGGSLPRPVSDHVLELAQRHGVSPRAILTAAVGAVVTTWAGVDELFVGATEAHRRSLEEFNGVIGCVNNTSLHVGRRLRSGQGFKDVAATAAKRWRRDLECSLMVPLERLAMARHREPDVTQLYEVLCVWHGSQGFEEQRTLHCTHFDEAMTLRSHAGIQVDMAVDATQGTKLEWSFDANSYHIDTIRLLQDNCLSLLCAELTTTPSLTSSLSHGSPHSSIEQPRPPKMSCADDRDAIWSQLSRNALFHHAAAVRVATGRMVSTEELWADVDLASSNGRKTIHTNQSCEFDYPVLVNALNVLRSPGGLIDLDTFKVSHTGKTKSLKDSLSAFASIENIGSRDPSSAVVISGQYTWTFKAFTAAVEVWRRVLAINSPQDAVVVDRRLKSRSTALLVAVACLGCAAQMNLSSASLETAANNGVASVAVTNLEGLKALTPSCGLERVVVTDLHLADNKCAKADLQAWGSRVVGVFLHDAVLGPVKYVDPDSGILTGRSLEGINVELVASGTTPKIGKLAFSGCRVGHTSDSLRTSLSSTKKSTTAIPTRIWRYRLTTANKRKQVMPITHTPPLAPALPEAVVIDSVDLFLQDKGDAASYLQCRRAKTVVDGHDVSCLLDAVHASLGTFVPSEVCVRFSQFNAGSSTASKRHVVVAVSPEMSQLESRVLLAKLRSAKLPIALVPSSVVSASELPSSNKATPKHPSRTTLEQERAFEARTWSTLVHEAMGNSAKRDGNNVLAHGDGLAWERIRYLAKERFNLHLPITLGMRCHTVESLVSALHTQEQLAATAGSIVPMNDSALMFMASSSSSGLVASASAIFGKLLTGGKKDTSEPLFLVHGHGGGVDTFKTLARRTQRPVFGIALTAEAPYTGTLQEQAAYFVDAIRVVSPSGPYRLGGFSSGATIAYEMALQLQSDKVQVRSLLLLDQAPLAMAALTSQLDTARLHEERYDLALVALSNATGEDSKALRKRMEREAPNPVMAPEGFAAWVLDQMGEAASATTVVQQMFVWSVHELESIKTYARGLQVRVTADEARGSAKKSFKLSAATHVTLVRAEGGGDHSVMRALQTRADGKHLAADFGLGALCTGTPVVATVAADHEGVGDTRLVADLVQ